MSRKKNIEGNAASQNHGNGMPAAAGAYCARN
jgi:hypothetical protein